MAEVELDNVRENGVKMSVETEQNNLRDDILSWISQKGKRRFLRNAQNIVNIVRRNIVFLVVLKGSQVKLKTQNLDGIGCTSLKWEWYMWATTWNNSFWILLRIWSKFDGNSCPCFVGKRVSSLTVFWT